MNDTVISQRSGRTSNNESDTSLDSVIGYVFWNDIATLKQAFLLPDIDYTDVS